MVVQSLDHARGQVRLAVLSYSKNPSEANRAAGLRAKEAYQNAKQLHDEHMAEHGD